MSTRRKTWFVTRRGRGWVVQRQDATAADSLHEHRDDAIARGIDLSRRARGTLRVKDERGRIEEEFTFSGARAPRRA
jgi:hypothetical protein